MKKQLHFLIVLAFLASGLFVNAQNPFTQLRIEQQQKKLNQPLEITDQDVPGRVLISATDAEITGSLGIGFDIPSPNAYGADTFVMAENNLRIYFNDTSNSASFPNNDWRLTANDQTNGGDNYFGIDDATAGTRPFRVDAGAGNNAIRIEAGGDVGINIANPVVKLHVFDTDTPTMRLDQVGGFGTHRWDIAGNETNFFIRDVTGGGTLPFRIRPGAPTSTLDINGNGAVGIGEAAPDANSSLDLGATDRGLLLNRMDNAGRTTLGGLLDGGDVGMIVYDTDDLSAYSWDGAAWQPVGTDTDDQTADVFQLNGNNLELSLEDDGQATLQVDLSSFLDNTDDQVADVFQLSGNNLELSLEDDGQATQQVDLSSFLDNTDDQVADVFQLTGNNLELSLEDDGQATQQVDLSGFLDNTDDQQLTLNVNSLDLEDGGSVDLTPYLDNTDNQDISGSGFAANILTIGISGGNSENVDLSALDNSGTDDQQLTLNGNSLDLEDGGSVDLSGYLDNTDDQHLGYALNGNVLTLLITGGNVANIDLTPLIQPLIDENVSQQAQIDDLIARVTALEDCACTLNTNDNDPNSGRATLSQNVPNPYDNTTTIGYYIPFTHDRANIVIRSITGQLIRNISLTQFGEGSIVIDRSRMASAIYMYTLYVDGKRIDTKRMVVE